MITNNAYVVDAPYITALATNCRPDVIRTFRDTPRHWHPARRHRNVKSAIPRVLPGFLYETPYTTHVRPLISYSYVTIRTQPITVSSERRVPVVLYTYMCARAYIIIRLSVHERDAGRVFVENVYDRWTVRSRCRPDGEFVVNNWLSSNHMGQPVYWDTVRFGRTLRSDSGAFRKWKIIIRPCTRPIGFQFYSNGFSQPDGLTFCRGAHFKHFLSYIRNKHTF